MKFRTEIEITSLGVKIGYENRVLALGSCFAAHIARKLAGAKFRVAENPSGILFNPLSIAAAIRSYADPAPVTRGELGFDGEVWHHFGFHGDFSAPTADEALQKMNAARQTGADALRTADRIVLTFGTAWVYERQGEAVANCHRRPAAEFTRRRLGVDEIELNITDKRLYLRTLDGAESLSVPRAGHDYPDYTVFMSRLEGDGVSLLTVNRKEAIEALGRIQIFNTDSDRCAYLDLGDNEVRLSAQGQDTGSANESLEVTYRGDISRIAFPTRNLMDVLGHFSSPSVDMILTGAEGPCGIRGSEDNEYTVIIMPMKISESTYYSEEDV